MGTGSLAQALKVPFEMLGSVAKKPRAGTAPYPLGSEGGNESALELTARQTSLPVPSAIVSLRNENSLKQKSNGDSITDDDRPDRESHLRKLFLKGHRVPPFDSRRPYADRMLTGAGGTKGQDRQAELRALDQALVKESVERQRQEAQVAETTRMEDESRARVRELEMEIYTDRAQRVRAARAKIAMVNNNLQQVTMAVPHYLGQIDQLAGLAQTSAEVEVVFPGLDQVRQLYVRPSPSKDEASDVLGPLRDTSGAESASGSEMRRPQSKQSTSRSGPKRRASKDLPTLYAFGQKPWPRRTSLAPDGTTSVNPIKRLEMAIGHAQSQFQLMYTQRSETADGLSGMIRQIDQFIKQKDAVRSWTKDVLESNRQLRQTIDALNNKLQGDWDARRARASDWFVDQFLRLVVRPIFRVMSVGLWMRRLVVRLEPVEINDEGEVVRADVDDGDSANGVEQKPVRVTAKGKQGLDGERGGRSLRWLMRTGWTVGLLVLLFGLWSYGS